MSKSRDRSSRRMAGRCDAGTSALQRVSGVCCRAGILASLREAFAVGLLAVQSGCEEPVDDFEYPRR